MSKIQWTDTTANPVKEAKEVGGKLVKHGNYCIPISPGCKNCYASTLNARGTRFGGNGRNFGVRDKGHPEMFLDFPMLLKWAKMRKPKKIFVGSMTDVFGEWVPDWMIFDLFDAMLAAPNQIFQVLTKRPERMSRAVCDWLRLSGRGQLPGNIWVGTSAENQAAYDERVKWLDRTLAQVRFLSLEPLLEPIVFLRRNTTVNLTMGDGSTIKQYQQIKCVDWVIIGGESGPNARPILGDWIIDILDQCKADNIPAFVKQLGSHWAKRSGAADKKGGDPDEWPGSLGAGVRMFPGETWE